MRILYAILITITNAQPFQEFGKLHSEQTEPQFKHRCTRRFTPGVCLEQVVVVWTFHFQNMNCTERLGCFQSHRTNRFKSYNICMKRCQPLIDLYLEILSFGEENDTSLFLRGARIPQRREGTELTTALQDPPDPSDLADYSGDEAVMANIMYKDSGSAEDEDEGGIRQDVDYVSAGFDPDDYLGFH